MQLVIELLDDYVSVVMQNQRIDGSVMDRRLRQAVIDGDKLPKNHGRLIDADALISSILNGTFGECDNTPQWSNKGLVELLDQCPAVLDAKGELQ